MCKTPFQCYLEKIPNIPVRIDKYYALAQGPVIANVLVGE
ncbi:hypothetical protein MTsDn5_29390 [Alteromonas gracilis]